MWKSSWIRNWVSEQADFKTAYHWAETFEPTPGKDYTWAVSHSVQLFSGLVDDRRTIESKAETLIGYLGAGSGALSLVFAYRQELEWWVVVPTLFLLLVSVFFALLARIPSESPSPPNVKGVMEYTADELDENRAKGKFLTQVHLACVALVLVNAKKSELTRKAYWSFFFALLWLGASSLFSRFGGVLFHDLALVLNPLHFLVAGFGLLMFG